jgi:hypothetical protein
MERIKPESKQEEIRKKFPEIFKKTQELKAILDWFKSSRAADIAPDEFTRKELHYPSIKGTDLKSPEDPTRNMHIVEAARERYIDLCVTKSITEGYSYGADPETQDISDETWRFLLGGLSGEDRNKKIDEINKEIEQRRKRIETEKLEK